MGWFDGILGAVDSEEDRKPRDPFGRVPLEPEFDRFRSAWKAGASLIDLFGDDPVKIDKPVGPEAPNRRPDVAKVETFLGRTGHIDLAKTDGPTGYHGGRVDAGIRRFQEANALTVDGLINPGGPTISTLRERIDGEPPISKVGDPCLGLWLDARAATERVLAIRHEITAKQAEQRELAAQMGALRTESPGTYAPSPPSVRRPSPGGSSPRAGVRDIVQAIGEAISLATDLSGAEDFIKGAQQRRETSASLRERVKTLEAEIDALKREEDAALAEERRRGEQHQRCKERNG